MTLTNLVIVTLGSIHFLFVVGLIIQNTDDLLHGLVATIAPSIVCFLIYKNPLLGTSGMIRFSFWALFSLCSAIMLSDLVFSGSGEAREWEKGYAYWIYYFISGIGLVLEGLFFCWVLYT